MYICIYVTSIFCDESTQLFSKFYYDFAVTSFAKIASGKLKPASIGFIRAEVSGGQCMHIYFPIFQSRESVSGKCEYPRDC